MSNRQFWSFLYLDFIYNTKFAKIFYRAICNFNDNSKLDYIKFMDYGKFLQFVAIFTKLENPKKINLYERRIKLLFALFDADNTQEVDRIEFRNMITCFIEMILQCRFDSISLQEKINNLNTESANIQMMEKVLDNYVEEVFNIFSYNGEFLSYEEWQKWLFTINGIQKILEFTTTLKS
jgi:Ca2+-binding EF-hand superfamily protein